MFGGGGKIQNLDHETGNIEGSVASGQGDPMTAYIELSPTIPIHKGRCNSKYGGPYPNCAREITDRKNTRDFLYFHGSILSYQAIQSKRTQLRVYCFRI